MAKAGLPKTKILEDMEVLSKNIRTLADDMRHDTFLSIIYTSDVVNRFLFQRLRKVRSYSTRFSILNALVTHNGSMMPTELSKSVSRSKYTITRVVDTLERDGLVKREIPDGDRRIRRVMITAKGFDFTKATMPQRMQISKEVTSFLTEEQMVIFCDLLKKLRKHLLKIM